MTASERLRELTPEGIVQTEYANQGYHDAVLLPPLLLPLLADCIQQLECEHPEPHNYWAADGTVECPACAALDALKAGLDGSS